jgi:triosephosphate isomerase
MRQQIVAGNWKMNNTLSEGSALVSSILEKIQHPKGLVVLAPPLTSLLSVGVQINGHEGFHLAAQNCHQESKGAYTGEVSAAMIAGAGASFVILGHSERRQYFHETNEMLAAKVNQALSHHLRPIFCCGEPLDIREDEKHELYVETQLRAGLFHLDEAHFRKVVIAYEPIWAIGTGKTATSAQAQEIHAYIRSVFAAKYGQDISDQISILYGGSVKASNANEIFSQPDVDGGLVGGASLIATEFAAIINALK